MINPVNAAEKSSKISTASWCWSTARRRSFCTGNKAVSVLWYLRYADCIGANKPFSCKYTFELWWRYPFDRLEQELQIWYWSVIFFSSSWSIPRFFSNGTTRATFNSGGICPVISDLLTTLVIHGRMTSKQFLSSEDGIGSREHDFVADSRMVFRTVSSDTTLNALNSLLQVSWISTEISGQQELTRQQAFEVHCILSQFIEQQRLDDQYYWSIRVKHAHRVPKLGKIVSETWKLPVT